MKRYQISANQDEDEVYLQVYCLLKTMIREFTKKRALNSYEDICLLYIVNQQQSC